MVIQEKFITFDRYEVNISSDPTKHSNKTGGFSWRDKVDIFPIDELFKSVEYTTIGNSDLLMITLTGGTTDYNKTAAGAYLPGDDAVVSFAGSDETKTQLIDFIRTILLSRAESNRKAILRMESDNTNISGIIKTLDEQQPTTQ